MKILVGILLLLQHFCYAQTGNWQTDAAPLHRAQKALTNVIIQDIFSPPVAARIYAYTNIAAYEVLVKKNKNYHSFYNQLHSFPKIPEANNNINVSLAAVNAFLITAKKLVFSEEVMQDSINSILKWYQHKSINKIVYAASMAYGKQVADSVLLWASKDKYKETRSLKRYNFSKEKGKWLPTPPVYMAAIEPYWNKIRPMVLDSCNQFRPELALPYSTDTNSLFYRQAKEVYVAGIDLSAKNKLIEGFWDCNPFAVEVQGHLNYATKKISPGGHWMSIAGIVCKSAGADMVRSAAAYALTAIAIFDGFIICWDEKYRSNVIRPETYINQYIDENWRPLLQTPPFPEYTSGHSVISTAAAKMLISLFGDNVGFDDTTEMEFGLPVRYFTSFSTACNEAAISRLYGGIHYMAAIENGQKQGYNLGNCILSKIHLSK